VRTIWEEIKEEFVKVAGETLKLLGNSKCTPNIKKKKKKKKKIHHKQKEKQSAVIGPAGGRWFNGRGNTYLGRFA